MKKSTENSFNKQRKNNYSEKTSESSPRIKSKEIFNELDEKLNALAGRLDLTETVNEIKRVLEFQANFYSYSFYN